MILRQKFEKLRSLVGLGLLNLKNRVRELILSQYPKTGIFVKIDLGETLRVLSDELYLINIVDSMLGAKIWEYCLEILVKIFFDDFVDNLFTKRNQASNEAIFSKKLTQYPTNLSQTPKTFNLA